MPKAIQTENSENPMKSKCQLLKIYLEEKNCNINKRFVFEVLPSARDVKGSRKNTKVQRT